MLYYIIISLSITLAVVWFVARAIRLKQSRVVAIDLAMVVLLAGFVGARLLHVFYEEPQYYLKHPLQIFEFWYGGFVYLGGLFLAMVAASLFCDKRKEPFWMWADLAAPPIALGYALGRVGCYFNGCCYGKRCELPWAVFQDGAYRHPTQLYMTFWEGLVLLLLLYMAPRLKKPGALFGLWLGLHGFGRLWIEQFRDDPRGPLLAGLSISTWLSAVLIGGGLTLFLSRVVPRLHNSKS